MKISLRFISTNCNPVSHPIAYFPSHPNILAYCSSNQVYIHNSDTVNTLLSLNLNKQGIDPGRCNVVRVYEDLHHSHIIAGYDSGHVVVFRCPKGELEKYTSWTVGVVMKQENSVTAVEVQGDLVVTINNSALLRVYRVEGAGEMKQLSKLEFPLSKIPEAVCIVPFQDNQIFLLIGGIDQLIHVYSSTKNLEFEYVNSLKGHENAITRIAATTPQLSKDLLIASSSRDGYIRIWKIVKEKEVPQFQKSVFRLTGDTFTYLQSILIAHECSVTNIAWVRFKQLSLVSASMDCTLGVWSKDQTGVWLVRNRLGQLYGNKNAFFSIMPNPHLSYLMAINFTGASCVWNYNKQTDQFEAKPSFTGHFSYVNSVCWDHTGNFLVSVSKDQTTRVYCQRKSTGLYHEVSRAQIHGYDINSVSLIKLRENCLDLIASGADQKVIRIIEPPASVANLINYSTKANLHLFFENTEEEAKYLKPSKDILEYTMVTEGGTQVLGLMTKVQKMERQKITTYYEEEEEQQVEQTKDASGPVSTTHDFNRIQTEDYLVKHTLWPEMNKLYGHPYQIICVTTNGNDLMASSCISLNKESAFVIIWDTKLCKIKHTLYHHNNSVNDIRFSRDGQYLLTVSKDRSYALYDRDFKLLHSQQVHLRAITNGDFSFDSKYIVTASRDRTIKIHQIQHKKTVAEFKFKKPVYAVSFAPKDYTLAVGCEDGSVHLVNLHEEKIVELGTVPDYQGHSGIVNRVSWVEKEGRLLLATCSKDHSLRVYEVAGL